MKSSHLFFLGVGIALVLTALLGTSLLARPYQYQGSVIDPAIPAPDFELIDQNEQPFRLSQRLAEDGRRKIALIFFGYVHCPDVCPVTLSEYRQIKAELGEQAEQIDFIFVTVDPQRDTPETLRKHLSNFDPDFVGLTGSQEQLEQVWKDFNIFVYQHEPSEAGGYLVDHTARVYVVGRQGELRMTYPFGTGAAVMAEDMRHMVTEK
ncbi:MAG: SCO family protein [Anaerolineales bacterium]